MSNRPSPFLTAQLFNTPLLIHPNKLADILVGIRSRLALPGELDVEHIRGQLSRFEGEWASTTDAQGRTRAEPYRRAGNVGIVSVVGTLVDRGGWVGNNSGLVSHEGIRHQLDRAARDPQVGAIVLDVASPGGEATGFGALAAKVREVASSKPVYAVANSLALSGGYALVSGATKIIASPSSRLGSIGVYYLHLDRSEQLANEGIKPTIIYAGEHKVDGNSTQPLDPQVREVLQNEVNAIYGEFLDVVAAGRGRRMSRKAAKETEARVYFPEEAVQAGLADGVGTFEEVVAAAQRRINRAAPARVKRTSGMDVLGNDDRPAITQEQVTAARTAGVEEGAKAERDRLTKILNDPRAKGRESFCIKLATKSPGMSADDVLEMAEAIPEAAAGASKPEVTADIRERVENSGANNIERAGEKGRGALTAEESAALVSKGWSDAAATAAAFSGHGVRQNH